MTTAVSTIDLIGGEYAPSTPLVDAFKRPINYLRISVTDRCNLRCVYCMPADGLPWIPNREVLTFDEIERVVAAAASVGVHSIRLTGGEPLLRPNLAELVARIADIEGIDDISLSTNGMLLGSTARSLAEAGLHRVNVSLDTLREDRFMTLARRPGLSRVIEGIDAALTAGLRPLKLNCVIMRGRNDDEILDFVALTRERELFVRFIEVMPVTDNLELQNEAYIPAVDVLDRIRAIDELIPIPGPPGNGPARYFRLPNARGAVGVISPLSHDYCETCNRVRLSADGRLKLCLFGENAIDFRTALRGENGSLSELADMFHSAMTIKPERHHLQVGEAASAMRAFSEIGG